MDSSVETIAADVWKELEEASHVEAPLNIKPFYDDMIKRKDPTTKILVDFKKPSEIILEICSTFYTKNFTRRAGDTFLPNPVHVMYIALQSVLEST
jgi:hypothetical protein